MRMERISGGDAQARLTRALVADAARAGCALRVVAAASRPWASATYVGEEQRLTLAAGPADAASGWLAALPDAELAMHGHVAMPPAIEAARAGDGDALTVELAVLTLVDG